MKVSHVVKSNLKLLVARRERMDGRRILGKDIALATGLDENTISRWLSPKPFSRLEVRPLIAFCNYFNCGIDDVVYIDRSH